MSWIDVHTALLFLGLLYLLAPAMTWAVLAHHRSAAAAYWCMGGMLFGAGILLASVADKVPAVVGILLMSTLMFASTALRIQSLRIDLGRPLAWRWIATMVFAPGVMIVITHWGLGWYVLRASLNSAMLAVMMGYLAHLAREVGRQDGSRNARLLAAVYQVFVLAVLVRVAEILLDPSGSPLPVARAGTTTLLTLTAMVTAVAGHFCYLGLMLDRALRREQTLQAEKARQEAKLLLQQQIRQVERQRSIDQMSVALAHELSQPVGAVLTNAQTGLRALEHHRITLQELAPLLHQIEQSARHASQVIERIRSFIQPSRMDHQVVDLRQVCDSACELAAADLRTRAILLERPPSPAAVLVQGDALELTQALLNGLRNAADALASSPLREIRVSCGTDAPWAWIRLEDSGPGLPAEQLHSAVAPFFTTKAGGLGLGLTIVESIAEQHGGRLLLAHAARGGLGGATFELRLPLLPPPQPANPPPSHYSPPTAET